MDPIYESKPESSGSQPDAKLEAQIQILVNLLPTQDIFETIKGRIQQTREIVNNTAATQKYTGGGPSLLQTATLWLDQKSSRVASLEFDFKHAGQSPSQELVETLVGEISNSIQEGILMIQALADQPQEASQATTAADSNTPEQSTNTKQADQIRILENKMVESNKQIRHLEYSVDTQQRELKQLRLLSEDQKKELKITHLQNGQYESQSKTNESYIEHLYSEGQELEGKIKLLEEDIEKGRKRESDLKGEIAAKTDECRSLEEAHSDDTRIKIDAKVMGLQKRTKELESDLADYQKANKDLWGDIAGLDEAKDKLQKDETKCRKGLSDAHRYIGGLNNELGNLSNNLDGHMCEGMPFEVKQADADYGPPLKILQKKCRDLVKMKDGLKRDIAQKNSRIEDLEESVVRLRETAIYGGAVDLQEGDLSNIDDPEPVSPAKFLERDAFRARAHSIDVELRQATMKEEIEGLKEENEEWERKSRSFTRDKAAMEATKERLKRENEELKEHNLLLKDRNTDLVVDVEQLAIAHEQHRGYAQLQLVQQQPEEQGWDWKTVLVLSASVLCVGAAYLWFSEWCWWKGANGLPEDRWVSMVYGRPLPMY
ncbi:hypothetical protein MMC10_004574 [Thelotrema lepadinum]|nr:hypothetical protein [Thelotrema lepadinum]